MTTCQRWWVVSTRGSTFCFFARLLFHFFLLSFSLYKFVTAWQLCVLFYFIYFKAAQLFRFWQLSNSKCLGVRMFVFFTVKAVVVLWCGLSTVRMKLNEMHLMRGKSYSTLRLDSGVVVVAWWWNYLALMIFHFQDHNGEIMILSREENTARDTELLHTDAEAPTGLCPVSHAHLSDQRCP